MTATLATPAGKTPAPEENTKRRLGTGTRWALMAAVLVVLFTITEELASPTTTDLASSGTWSTALAFGVPIMAAGLGGMFSERAGVVNIGLEGMLILGTWFGAWGAFFWGPWGGMAAAIIGGSLGGLLHAVATVSYGVNHIISGVAINLLAPGLTRFMSNELFISDPEASFPNAGPGGSVTQSPRVSGVAQVDVPLLGGGFGGPDILGNIEDRDWPFISQASGIAHGFVTDLSLLTIVAWALVPLSIWLLWHTNFGLRLRSAGEHPIAADSLGVNVIRYKYWGVLMSGALAGFGGGFLVIELTGLYKEGQTGGRGFIGLATMIFGNYRPVGTAAGALLFGFTDTLQLRDPAAAHGLLLLLALTGALFTARLLWTRRWRPAALLGVTSLVIFIWYATTDDVIPQLAPSLPFFAVLLVLALAGARLRMPAMAGQPYRKGDH